jgi:alpha-N-arabinofuranosidase
VAQWLNVFLRKSDVLKIACLAQIVNTISPLTTRGEELLKQTTYYPLMLTSQHARGAALDLLVQAPEYETKRYGMLPVLDVSASYEAASGQGAIFIVNRSQHTTLATELVWQGVAPTEISGGYQIAHSDPKATNTFEQPETIIPQALAAVAVQDGRAVVSVPPLSFSVWTYRV